MIILNLEYKAKIVKKNSFLYNLLLQETCKKKCREEKERKQIEKLKKQLIFNHILFPLKIKIGKNKKKYVITVITSGNYGNYGNYEW